MSTITDDDLTRLLDEAASSYDVPEHGPDEVLAALADQPVPLPMVRRRWVQLSAAAAVVTAGAVVAATQLGGPSTQTLADRSAAAKRAPAHALAQAASPGQARSLAPAATGNGYTSLSSGAAADGGSVKADLSQSAVVPEAPSLGVASGSAAGAGTGGAAAGAGSVAAAPAGRVGAAPQVGAPVNDQGDSRVVKTGSLALVVKNGRVTPTLTAVEKAAKLDGGYISAGTTNEYGDTPSGEVSIRVPVNKFEDLVAQVRGLDAKVRTATTSGKDVTAQYSDLQSQLKSLNATRDRFYIILTKTKTIGEILTVQQRIDNVSAQIDQIQGQRKLLASQSDLSTLTVSVSEADDPVVKVTQQPRSGLSQSFHDAWDGFVTGVEAIISHSGRALLWLLSLGLLLLAARGGWRVARRRMV
jgi:hypothetical protein